MKDEHTAMGIAVSFGCSSRQLRIESLVSRLKAGLDTACLPLAAAVSSVSSLRLTAESKSSNDIISISVALRAALAALLGVATADVSPDPVHVKVSAYSLC